METRSISLFWRIFAVNATLLSLVALLLIVTPIEISAPIAPIQALIIVAGLVVAMVANGLLSRRAIAPLERLAQRMDTVDLLRPGQRLAIGQDDEVGHVVRAFNRMLDRLESERRQSGQRMIAAHEAARVSVARDLHDEVGQLLTGVLLQLDSIADAAPEGRGEIDEAKEAVRRALDEVRRISSELRPEMLEHLGLLSALTELATTFGRASGIRVQREFDVVTACARAGRQPRDLPDRAGEPDQCRASCASRSGHDRDRGQSRQRRPARLGQWSRIRHADARRARRLAKHA